MNLDFETYSAAGTFYNLETQSFKSANVDTVGLKRGLPLVGAYVYAEHPSTEVTVACYSFDGGKTIETWRPGNSPPLDLFAHVQGQGVITAWNSFFEWCIWNLVCVPRYGWPPLPLSQTNDTMAAAVAWSLPGALDKASAVVFGESQKDAEGKNIMMKFSQPRNATKNDRRLRFKRDVPKDDKEAERWVKLDAYCAQDVRAECNIAASILALSPRELEVWQLDQKINARGIQIDTPLVEACFKIMKEAKTRGGLRLSQLTGGTITAVSEATKILDWVNSPEVRGKFVAHQLKSLELDVLQEYLDATTFEIDLFGGSKTHPELVPGVREVLEIRRDTGGNAPGKLVPMKYQAAKDGRVRGVFQYCGAQRTRRWAGRGIQTQNMINSGLKIDKCPYCGRASFRAEPYLCICGNSPEPLPWGIEAIEAIIPSLLTGNYSTVAARWGNPAKAVAVCLRSMLISAPGYDYISSDYSAVEAVVMACMAGEQWIIDVFNTDGKLYERTGSKITGTPFDQITKDHPARKLGKVASLASQFQGARGAWLKFGAGEFLSNEEIDDGVKAWREASPNIVNYWYAVEDAAKAAVTNPGWLYSVPGANVGFRLFGRALYCILPNGEWLTYLDPEIKQKKKLSSEGWKILKDYESQGVLITKALRHKVTNDHYEWKPALFYWGQSGQNKSWQEIDTYGGKLAENITQATARFLLSEALLRVEAAGYPVVMHTHDEIVSEVPEGFGSVEEFEDIMAERPTWASDWPIKAAGGWRGKRYRK